LYDTDLIGSYILKLLSGLYRTFLMFIRDYGFFFNIVNHAAASPWLRRSWSRNYSVLVIILIDLRNRKTHSSCS
jgi:hypothetical protein